MTAMYSAILSLGHMEEELSTACRAAADALEILSNLRPGFTRNVMVHTEGRGLRFSRNDRTVEVIKLFIIWRKYTGFLITLCFLFASP